MENEISKSQSNAPSPWAAQAVPASTTARNCQSPAACRWLYRPDRDRSAKWAGTTSPRESASAHASAPWPERRRRYRWYWCSTPKKKTRSKKQIRVKSSIKKWQNVTKNPTKYFYTAHFFNLNSIPILNYYWNPHVENSIKRSKTFSFCHFSFYPSFFVVFEFGQKFVPEAHVECWEPRHAASADRPDE